MTVVGRRRSLSDVIPWWSGADETPLIVSADGDQVITRAQFAAEVGVMTDQLPAALNGRAVEVNASTLVAALASVCAVWSSGGVPIPLAGRPGLLDGPPRRSWALVSTLGVGSVPVSLAVGAEGADDRWFFGLPSSGSTGAPSVHCGMEATEGGVRAVSAVWQALGGAEASSCTVVGGLGSSSGTYFAVTALVRGLTQTGWASDRARPGPLTAVIGSPAWVYCPTAVLQISGPPFDLANMLDPAATLVHGGSPCPVALKRRLIAAFGSRRIYEFYGASEGIGLTVIRGDESLAHPGSVGRGLFSNIEIRDENGRAVPAGSIGTIYMGRGSDRLKFRTVGDVGYVDEESYLFVRGRAGSSASVGGFLVDWEETRRAILEIDGVEQVEVRVVPSHLLGEKLTASVVVSEGSDVSRARLRSLLARRLAREAIPLHIHVRTND